MTTPLLGENKCCKTIGGKLKTQVVITGGGGSKFVFRSLLKRKSGEKRGGKKPSHPFITGIGSDVNLKPSQKKLLHAAGS